MIVRGRSHLKNVFSAELGLEPSSQVLDILKYACGLRLGIALISGKNPNFEIASSNSEGFKRFGFSRCWWDPPRPASGEVLFFHHFPEEYR